MGKAIINTQAPPSMTLATFSSIVEMAGYGVAYWCSSMESTKSDVPYEELGEGWFYTASCKFVEDETKKEFVLSPEDLAKAVVELVTQRKLNTYYMSAIDNLALTGETWEVGSDIADAIVQQGCFGEVVYG